MVGKRRGSGFLAFQDELNRFLEEIYGKAELNISIKTRLGKYNPEEFEALLDIYNQYPLEELIIHPRTREEFYRGKPNLTMFQLGFTKSRCPVCYNGNIFTKPDYDSFCSQFPEVTAVMLGRGLVANPALIDVILGEREDMDKLILREFHDRIYADYSEMMSGEVPLLYKMKEFWNYAICLFADTKKYGKKIRKAQSLKSYNEIVNALFETEEIVQGAGFKPNE